ncbi:WD40 repeat-like protein [Halteromyces radiatus]|uniref:WD40 repeat-like protein n=1 Tax=Halteromyces radiatus TaxID=101107 RepID=UPI002221296F|nr:WD40 repeat-like protein [Halteromyces radiatus]KAI8085126.1 WD40 repeat-like protein [Halteromyces radiatus]
MKSSFKFSNLCGTVYTNGNLVFTPDGNSIISPVGNRVSVFDLVNNKSCTLPFEMRRNISCIALSPQATLLITIDDSGRGFLINFPRQTVLHQINFKSKVKCIKFSPNGKYVAITHDHHIQVWRTPGFTREFSPFVLHRTYTGHHDDVSHISWSPDSKYFLTTSRDMTARLYSTNPTPGFTPVTLSGHRAEVIGAYFSKDMKNIYTISKDGALFQWRYSSYVDSRGLDSDEEMELGEDFIDHVRWRIQNKHYFNQGHGVKVRSCEFYPASNLIIAGFTNGIFGLYEVPSFTTIHTLSISQKKISTVAINPSGEWLAFGCATLGQLLVWEWQSETYVLKQQGHHYDMNAVSYSPDGQTMATGGDDGKVKIWNATSGFCFVTFSDHNSSVKAVEFAKQGQVVFSASLDGTVRAFDLVRYRNFRTFTSPNPVQFASLAVDPSGEIVCAGTMDTFEIYVWSVQTGKLLDILAGHEGPISSLDFSSSGMALVSGSWDHTVRVWDVFGRNKHIESLQHQSEVLAVAYRPDGKQVAASTLDGQISFWDVHDSKLVANIEGRKDISGGRKVDDRTTSENSASGKSFNSLCYTADGSSILAGGNSKYICLYDIESTALIKKFQISNNLSLDGTQEMLSARNMTQFGSKETMDDDDEPSDLEDRIDHTLPGTQGGDLSVRKTRPEVRSMAVRFSPTGRAWAAATTDGLLIYSLDDAILFDPFDLELDITPDSVLETLDEADYLKAICMAFRLNEKKITQKVFEGTPPDSIPLVARGLPEKYLDKLLKFIGTHMETSPHIEFHLLWVTSLLTCHGRYLKQHRGEFQAVFRALYKGVTRVRDDIANLCDSNVYTLKYLLSQQALANKNTDVMMN